MTVSPDAAAAPEPLTMAEVDQLDAPAFIDAFGHVYEDSPGLAMAVWAVGPHHGFGALADAFAAALDALDDDAQLDLLRAHPQLGARTLMTAASTTEQAGAGLDQVDDAVRQDLADGNQRYLDRFGFPFIIAVQGLGVDDILAALVSRLTNDPSSERATAVEQVRRIARLRLDAMVAP